MTGVADARKLPTDELLAAAPDHARAGDSELYWNHVAALHWRPEPEVFQSALRWCRSAVADERQLGADVLGQLGAGKPTYPFAGESRRPLWELVNDPANDVVQAAIVALGHLGVSDGASRLVAAASSPDSDVRQAVAYALGGSEEPVAVALLIELTSDTDTEVRSWATFGLGSLGEADSPALREALLSRLQDADDETRGEALLGLAVRGDERVLEPLVAELQSECVGTLSVEAAKELADPCLVPALTALLDWWDVDVDLLNDALEACKG